MGLLRIAAAGALGYFAYQAWQRRAASSPVLETDTDAVERTAPSLVTDVSDTANRASHDDTTAPRGANAH